MERSATRDLVVGLFVLAGIGAVAYLSISIGGFAWHGHGRLKLVARFGEIGGLTIRSPIMIAGVRVGEVSKIELDDHFRARLELSFDSDMKLPKMGTGAAIVTAGMLGDRYVQIKPGDDETFFQSGDEIPHTEKALILEELLGQVVYGLTKDHPNDQPKDKAVNTTTQSHDLKNK